MENKVSRAAIYTRKSSEEGLEQCRVKCTSCTTRHPQRPVSEFNSLDAQREALRCNLQRCTSCTRGCLQSIYPKPAACCPVHGQAALRTSLCLKHEGWVLVDKEYSDGGISGGTLNRSAVQELLQDIKTGEVNMIVVYKIDRRTG